MTVWVVWWSDRNQPAELKGIFSSQFKAQQWIADNGHGRFSDYGVEPMEVR